MKEIEYTAHAEAQIKLRNIREKTVRETIEKPLSVICTESNRKVAQKIYNIKGKKTIIRVIFEETKDKIEVITAYKTSKIMKYLKGS